MKKLLLGLLMMAGTVFGADTYTTRLGLTKPEEGSSGWGAKIRNNYDIIDSSVAILSSTQTFTGGVTMTSGTISVLRANQVIVGSPTYSGNASIYTTGSALAAYLNLGGPGIIGPPYITFSNGSVGTQIQIYHDGSVNGGMALRALNGVYALSPSDNTPVPVKAKSILAGPNYFTLGSDYVAPNDSGESAFEYAVLIGTVTNTANSKVVILSSSAYAYDLVVGSAPVPQGKYHLAVSTGGNVYIPSLASGECMQVGSNGLLTTTGSGCGSGGGGGASALAVFEDTTKISSPTAIVKFDGTDFNASLLGAATAYITLGDSITVTGITASSLTAVYTDTNLSLSQKTIVTSTPTASGSQFPSTIVLYSTATNSIPGLTNYAYLDVTLATNTYRSDFYIQAGTDSSKSSVVFDGQNGYLSGSSEKGGGFSLTENGIISSSLGSSNLTAASDGTAYATVTTTFSVLSSGTAGQVGAALRLRNGNNDGGYTILRAPSTGASDLLLVLPTADGSNGQALTTDGSGNLSFATVSGSGGSGIVSPGTFTWTNTYGVSFSTVAVSTITSTGDVAFDPVGDVKIMAFTPLRFYDSDNSNYTALRSSAVVSADAIFTLPQADGTAGQVLTTDGNKTWYFSTVSGGSGSGIVSPGTFTWTNIYGVSVSTIAASQWITASSVTFTSATIAGCTFDSAGIGCQAASAPGEMRLYEDQTNGSNYIAFIASSSLTGDVTWTLPDADGSGCFQSNGAGVVTIGSCGSSDNLGNGTGSFGVNTSTGGFSSWVSVSSNTYLAAGNTFYYNASPQFENAPIVNALTASSWVKTDANKKLVTADNNGSVGISYDGAGSALTAGGTSYITAPYTGTITGWTLVATSTGSLVIDVKKCAGFNCNPTTSIAGSEIPTLSSVWANQDLSLGTWTTDITEGDKIAFVMNSAATITNATLTIHVRKQ